uniref:Uncharacterized protein n=1 Tax=Solanum lycopersicum TaxID=4081 RepID=A0A3Q7H693_SOLLC
TASGLHDSANSNRH